jgi:hypothetical protein
MAPRTGGKRIGRLASLGVAVVTVLAAQPASAGDPAPCRVRNVTQDTAGSSLARMVESARDGDRLRVRGTCPGKVVIEADVVIRGLGERPAITGEATSSGVVVERGAVARLQDLEIRGASDGGLRNRGRLTLRAVDVHHNGGSGIVNSGKLAIFGSTIRANSARFDGDGGGIVNVGRLKITGSLVQRNSASDSSQGETEGGGISNLGHLVIRGSRIRGNLASGAGGGIENQGVATTIHSTVTGNVVSHGHGGGLTNYATLTLKRTSVTANSGGGIDNWRRLVLDDSLVTRNTSASSGGGIRNKRAAGARVTLDADSSVTGNTPDDCVGTPAC